MGASFSTPGKPRRRFGAAQTYTGHYAVTGVRPLVPRLAQADRSPTASPQRPQVRPELVAQPGVTFTAMPVQGAAMFARPGPAGPTGGEPQVFEFDVPSSEWVCVHDLGRLPQITVYDADGNVRPFVLIENPSEDVTIVNPTPPLAGKVVII